MNDVSRYQMFAVMVLFQLGTTIIFGFAAAAGRDAWISATISMLLGTALVLGFLTIHRLNGGLSLVEWYPALFGRWIGTPIAWLYPMIFLYDAGRIVTDIRFLFPVTILHRTPEWAVTGSFLLVVVYAMFGGFEVISRIAAVLFPVILLFILLEIVLLVASGSLNLHNLQPTLASGWGPIGKAMWPLGLMQTFGESVVFAIFWQSMRGSRRGRAFGVIGGATLTSGLFIVSLDMLNIAGLGEGLFKTITYPSFALLKLASLANFLENLDPLGILYLMITAFVKLSVYMTAAVVCIRRLTKAPKDGPIIVLVAIAVLLVSLTMATNYTEHMLAGFLVLPRQVWLPLFLVLPGMALAVTLFKRMRKGARN